MQSPLHIDDDLLAAVESLARQEGRTAGEVISRLLRQALTGQGPAPAQTRRRAAPRLAGFEPFPARPGVVTTNDQVDALREAEGV